MEDQMNNAEPKAVEPKVGMIAKFKQSDESVKLAVAVGVGVTVGIVGTIALQAYGRSRENKVHEEYSHPVLPSASQEAPRITVLRMPALGQ